MKTIGRITGLGAALMWCAAMCLGIAGTAAAQTGATYCEVQLEKCPDEYDGDTLRVPLDVIAFSAGVQACEIKGETVVQGGDPPAIMFIIDHTNSMGTINDTRGNRFRVTRALIDSVYNAFPNAEVGVVVFDAGLFLNSGKVSDPNLATFGGTPYYNPDTAVEKYMPLMRLNAPAQGGGFYTGAGNPTAYQVYDRMFYVPTSTRDTAGIRNPTGTGNNPIFGNGSGTNVSIAFEAALEQFNKTGVAKENQYIIFISDGRYEMNFALVNGGCDETAITDPSRGGGLYGNSARCSKQRDFMAGIIGGQKIPTTYTVFLNTDAEATMRQNRATLDTMTLAIKDNGYSNTNLSSNIWTADGNNYSGLMTLMMENIFKDMLSKSSGAPKRITISSSGGAADSAGTISGGNFNFRRQLPIDTADVTTVKMDIRYDVVIEVDTVLNGVATTITRKVTDSLFTYSFTVRRTENPPADWQTGQGLKQRCETKPTLDLLYNNVSVSVVKGNMGVLTVRLDNTGNLFNYDKVDVTVMNADGSIKDIEDFPLSKNGNVWTYDFVRREANDANPAIPGNKALEHASLDSIIVVFRNPYIPLDTVRLAVPYISADMAFYDKPGDPKITGAREYVEEQVVCTAGVTLDIYAKFFTAEGNWDPSMEADPSKMKWQVNDPANARLTPEGVHGAFYSETAGRVYTVTATYTDGALTISRKLHIMVVPAAAEYLEVVFKPRAEDKVDPKNLKEKEYEFGKDVSRDTFYVVERDKFGNRIGEWAEGATWESNNTASITANMLNNGGSAEVSRQGNTFVDGLQLTVKKNGLSTVVNIKVIGESSVAIGPNPFVPGRDNVKDMLRDIDSKNNSNTYAFYEDIINRTGSNASPSVGVSNNGTGVLVAATAPKKIDRNNNLTPKVTIVIYDAVGNVVFRSKPNDVILIDESNTFGFVWDGKNTKGRTVGPGTYLVRIVGTQNGGTKFSSQRRVGVTVRQ